MSVSFTGFTFRYRTFSYIVRRRNCLFVFVSLCIAWIAFYKIIKPLYLNYIFDVCKHAKSINIDMTDDFIETEFVWPVHLNEEEIELILDGHDLSHHRLYSDFEYPTIINPKRKCNYAINGRPIDTLFLIKSAPGHFEHRFAIRNSWGDESLYRNIRRIFLIGLNENLNANIRNEAMKYDDVVQINFTDTYYNNTLKLTNGLLWASEWCAHSTFVIMVDDDYFVSTNRLLKYLSMLPKELKKRLYLGERIFGCEALTIKLPSNKWYISDEEYPYGSFPPFITGGTIIMTSGFVHDVVKLIPYTKPFMFDDVYIGFIAKKLNVSVIGTKLVTKKKITPTDKLFDSIIATHMYKPYELLNLRENKSLPKNDFKAII